MEISGFVLLGENSTNGEGGRIHLQNEGLAWVGDVKHDIQEELILQTVECQQHLLSPDNLLVGRGSGLQLLREGARDFREILHVRRVVLRKPQESSELRDALDHLRLPISNGLQFAWGGTAFAIEKDVSAERDHGHEEVDFGPFCRHLMSAKGVQDA